MKFRSRYLSQASCLVLAAVLVLSANGVRPYPFSTTDDNWMYFLPIIKSHTDALLGLGDSKGFEGLKIPGNFQAAVEAVGNFGT